MKDTLTKIMNIILIIILTVAVFALVHVYIQSELHTQETVTLTEEPIFDLAGNGSE